VQRRLALKYALDKIPDDEAYAVAAACVCDIYQNDADLTF
jgi:hypothetical protein